MSGTRRLDAKTTLIVVCLLVVAAGIGGWFYAFGSQDEEGTCHRLLKHERTRTALGSAYEPDLTCAELGEAIVGATTGKQAGRHSLSQAQAMKDVLLALADTTEVNDSSLDPELTAPVSLALADYAPDVFGVLAPGSIDYLRHELPSDKAWEDGKGAHMSVPAASLLRVMVGLSADPDSYANLHRALTGRVAEELPGAAHDKTESALSPYPTVASWVVGDMNAVAAAAREGLGQSESSEWDKKVLARLTEGPAHVPSFGDDPSGHITGSWRATLPRQVPDDLLEVLEAQGAEMTRAWATALGTSEEVARALVRDAQESAFSARRSALRDYRSS
ncbi:hypothetical protein ABZ023_11525 [Streptomyces sp. NPDC006367]|uniref:hypothetical protein n=1 Tax=unclassified Streptomyces TaxID=2593676 RepID=UPI0033AAEA26